MSVQSDLSVRSAVSPLESAGGCNTDRASRYRSMLQLPLTAYQATVTECPVCGKELASAKGLGSHVSSKHPYIHTTTERIRSDFGTDPATVLRALHHGAGLTVQEISQKFGYHREQIAESFELLEVSRDRRTGLEQIWQDRSDEASEWAKENASLGAAGRTRNGMKGKTGQANPNWRGGKSIYDSVKKQLHGPSWQSIADQHRSDTCENCGVEGNTHLHHIIPIMDGGTNEPWNLMTLCPSCHHKAEWRTRAFSTPVLVD